MNLSVKLCNSINRFFPLPVHPFNLQNEGVKTYSEWQFEKGMETIKFYLDKFSIEGMFKDKVVLDIGCGAGGKTLFYASQGVKKIYGIDVVEKYKAESGMLAQKLRLSHCFKFVLGDAAKMEFEDNLFDVIIMNDAMEHVDQPSEVLKECYRVLKPGGKLFLNFPPYYHPFGAHLSDAIGLPWAHLFFNDETLIEVYKDAVKDLPDGEERINFRISKDESGKEYFSYINRMTISRFEKIMENSSFKVSYYKEIPLRNFLGFLARLPAAKECFVKMVVCIFEK